MTVQDKVVSLTSDTELVPFQIILWIRWTRMTQRCVWVNVWHHSIIHEYEAFTLLLQTLLLLQDNRVYEEIREEDRRSTSPPVDISSLYTSVKYTKQNETTDVYSFATAATSHETVSWIFARMFGFTQAISVPRPKTAVLKISF